MLRQTNRAAKQKTIINRLDLYTEIRPTGTGYQVLLAADLPDRRNY